MKKKIICPGEIHSKANYEKLLLGFEERAGKAPLAFYVHCGDIKCNKWYKIQFDGSGSFFLVELPPKHYLSFDKVPIAVTKRESSKT